MELGSSDRPADLLGEGVDCAVRGGDVYDESLAARRLGELPVVTCAAPAYLARCGEPRAPADLQDHTFVHFFSPRAGRIFPVELERGGEALSLLPPHRVAANDSDTWIALAVAGLGILQAPCAGAVREHLQAGRLRRILPGWRAPSLPLYALYPQNRRLAARVRVFVDWVAELYARECALAEAFLREADRGPEAAWRPSSG